MPDVTRDSPPCRSAVAACDRLLALIDRAVALDAPPADSESVHVPVARYAAALLRQKLRPALDSPRLADDPLHVVVFGGTNSGKSTVLNLLLGRPAAAMSFRARFSQHPEAYRLAALGNRFLDAFPTRFADYTRYQDRHPPRQDDNALRAEGYRAALAVNDPTRLDAPPLAPPAASAAIFWDIPDFSTEEAQLYLPTVLDTLALADLVVMTLTRENYADHRGRLLRGLILDSRIPLLVVANKLEPGSALLDDVRRKLAEERPGHSPTPADRILPLPQVVAESEVARLDRLLATPEATELRRRVAAELATGPRLRHAALLGGSQMLQRHLDQILAPLHAALTRHRDWESRVASLTRSAFLDPYRRDYLDGERYVEFNQALVKVLDLLEVPGIGPIVSGVSRGLRSASRWVFATVARGVQGLFGIRSTARRGPELDAIAHAFERWIEALRGEAQSLAAQSTDPAWPAIVRTLASPSFLPHLADSLGAAYLDYRARIDQITSDRAHTLYNLITQRPRLLTALRGIKLSLDVGTTSLIVASGGLDWTDAVVGPLVAPLQRLALEAGLDPYLQLQKTQLKQQQLAALTQLVEQQLVQPVQSLYHVPATTADLAAAAADAALLTATFRSPQ
ncbi:MAG: hypothetical protein KatS3mg108_3844 [Isosphaeraceae bacterium]|jgi:hypothetical protein|nr:MAG: hypothetical protein KatS3mg108_3844 [Isosphaeraceae bacterium]